MDFELDYSDIIEIFKHKLKIDNSVKSISHTFLNKRYVGKIDFQPYFQRKYVWDAEKATYFIESILLGTYPLEIKTYVYTKTSTHIFIASLFIIACAVLVKLASGGGSGGVLTCQFHLCKYSYHG